MKPRVTIVGGGLAGASLACALETLDLDITVAQHSALADFDDSEAREQLLHMQCYDRLQRNETVLFAGQPDETLHQVR